MKNQTPVKYLEEKWYSDENVTDRTFQKALQMEAKKQKKYNEMLEMLKVCQQAASSKIIYDELEQLIKEATEL